MHSAKRRLGNVGEDIAALHLKRDGFVVLDRNYLKKCGEIDIVARKNGVIHFIEVKSVSREINLSSMEVIVTRENPGEGAQNGVTREMYRPEDNVHQAKLRRLAKTIELYLEEKRIPEDQE